jgi:hypothetical protein
MTLKSNLLRNGYEPGDTIKFGSIVFQYVMHQDGEGVFILKECPEGMSHITKINFLNGNWFCGIHPGNTPWHAYVTATTRMLQITKDEIGRAERDLHNVKQRQTALNLVLAVLEAQVEGEAA